VKPYLVAGACELACLAVGHIGKLLLQVCSVVVLGCQKIAARIDGPESASEALAVTAGIVLEQHTEQVF